MDAVCAVPGVLLVALAGGEEAVAWHSGLVESATRPYASPRVEAFHLHHDLRGEDADRVSRHCFQVCYRLGIPIHVVHEDLDRQLGPGQPSLETLSRDKRRSHIEKVATSRNCPHVLLGHHADDQAETLLGNLLRGCGLKGLSGMHPVTPLGQGGIRLLRPFLDIRKQHLIEHLEQSSLTAVEDSSNDSPQHRRNRIRHQLIPAMVEESPELVTHLTQLADEMGARWKQQEGKLMPRLETVFYEGPYLSFPPHSWEGLEDHEIADLFREALLISGSSGGQLSRGHLHGLLRLTAGSNSPEVELPGNRRARRCGRWIHISPEWDTISMAWTPKVVLGPDPFEFLGLHWEIETETSLTVRAWQPQDRWPDRESRSVETLRVAGIPAEMREWRPVLIDSGSGDVLGSPGITGPTVHLAKIDLREIQPLGFHLLRVTRQKQ